MTAHRDFRGIRLLCFVLRLKLVYAKEKIKSEIN
jgi:hypothetical protein